MIKTDNMNKRTLKVSVSDSDSSSVEDSEESENEVEMTADDVEAEGESDSAFNENDASSEGDASNDDKSDDDVLLTNEGWKNSVSKILGSNKPKNKKTLVLSRAKKQSEIVKTEKEEKPAFEVIGDSKEDKPKVKIDLDASTEPLPKKKKTDKASIRIKPNILEKDRERLLAKVATKGVVQLFNAVRNQQKTIEKTNKSDITEGHKEKILKKFDKRAFLDTLMGQTKSVVVDEATKKYKDEVKEEERPKWNALRDDFMMGAKMKDWNKESDEDD